MLNNSVQATAGCAAGLFRVVRSAVPDFCVCGIGDIRPPLAASTHLSGPDSASGATVWLFFPGATCLTLAFTRGEVRTSRIPTPCSVPALRARRTCRYNLGIGLAHKGSCQRLQSPAANCRFLCRLWFWPDEKLFILAKLDSSRRDLLGRQLLAIQQQRILVRLRFRLVQIRLAPWQPQ